jgi:elongation factor P
MENVYIDRHSMQYLYSDGDSAVFMDLESYEQEGIPLQYIEDEQRFLKEGLEVDVSFYEGQFISLDLPIFVELKVTHTEPGLKGDTATTTFKSAEVETGARFQVPLFINEGDRIKIDTRSGEYIERV